MKIKNDLVANQNSPPVLDGSCTDLEKEDVAPNVVPDQSAETEGTPVLDRKLPELYRETPVLDRNLDHVAGKLKGQSCCHDPLVGTPPLSLRTETTELPDESQSLWEWKRDVPL